MKKILLATLLCLPTTVLQAQSLWTSAEFKAPLTNRFSLSIEGENRTHDSFNGSERWSGGLGADYKLCSWLKASAGYTYIYQNVESRTTRKGNIISAYWQPRHRAWAALTGSYSWQRFKFSLRERYQLTHRTGMSVAKFDGDDGSQKADEHIKSSNRQSLRSRLEVEYSIRKSGFTPFASCELYNSLTDFSKEKTRWTVGTEYEFNKHHSVNLFYRYIDTADEDDPNSHVIGIGYQFKL